MDWKFFAVLAIMLAGISAVIIYDTLRKRRFANATIVNGGVDYPNNHHVLGVGYYHAASRQWFANPWNEFREQQGYYWNGCWHPEPDQRTITRSMPNETEVTRVNHLWREADPDAMQRFWANVERFGFGRAVNRPGGG